MHDLSLSRVSHHITVGSSAPRDGSAPRKLNKSASTSSLTSLKSLFRKDDDHAPVPAASDAPPVPKIPKMPKPGKIKNNPYSLGSPGPSVDTLARDDSTLPTGPSLSFMDLEDDDDSASKKQKPKGKSWAKTLKSKMSTRTLRSNTVDSRDAPSISTFASHRTGSSIDTITPPHTAPIPSIPSFNSFETIGGSTFKNFPAPGDKTDSDDDETFLSMQSRSATLPQSSTFATFKTATTNQYGERIRPMPRDLSEMFSPSPSQSTFRSAANTSTGFSRNKHKGPRDNHGSWIRDASQYEAREEPTVKGKAKGREPPNVQKIRYSVTTYELHDDGRETVTQAKMTPKEIEKEQAFDEAAWEKERARHVDALEKCQQREADKEADAKLAAIVQRNLKQTEERRLDDQGRSFIKRASAHMSVDATAFLNDPNVVRAAGAELEEARDNFEKDPGTKPLRAFLDKTLGKLKRNKREPYSPWEKKVYADWSERKRTESPSTANFTPTSPAPGSGFQSEQSSEGSSMRGLGIDNATMAELMNPRASTGSDSTCSDVTVTSMDLKVPSPPTSVYSDRPDSPDPSSIHESPHFPTIRSMHNSLHYGPPNSPMSPGSELASDDGDVHPAMREDPPTPPALRKVSGYASLRHHDSETMLILEGRGANNGHPFLSGDADQIDGAAPQPRHDSGMSKQTYMTCGSDTRDFATEGMKIGNTHFEPVQPAPLRQVALMEPDEFFDGIDTPSKPPPTKRPEPLSVGGHLRSSALSGQIFDEDEPKSPIEQQIAEVAHAWRQASNPCTPRLAQETQEQVAGADQYGEVQDESLVAGPAEPVQQPAQVPVEDMSYQQVRSQLELPPLLKLRPGDTPHPHHHLTWNSSNVMCHDIHTTSPQNNKSKKCFECGEACCYYAERLETSKMKSRNKHMTHEIAIAAKHLEIIRQAYPNGVEPWQTLMTCDQCMGTVCTEHATLCSDPYCFVPLCLDCAEQRSLCVEHQIQDDEAF